jgi:predicted phage terminase large subunit-like protein
MTDTKHIIEEGIDNPLRSIRGLVKSNLYMFVKYFWSAYSSEEFKGNWHIEYICEELEIIAKRVIDRKPKLYDLIVNVPPGTSKTSTIMIMYPLWVWVNAYDIRFITASYTSALSLESAEYSRDVVRSDKFQQLFPEIGVKEDKDTKSNFRVIKKEYRNGPYKQPNQINGGNRFSTSVGGTLTGFHGHMLLVDDPLDPKRAISKTELDKANRWISETLSTRKVDKQVTPMILVMQRLHENDPTGYLLKTKKDRIKHICLPAEIKNYKHKVKPVELMLRYTHKLLDPVRMPMRVLNDMEGDLGQYGYAGQIGQDPTPPGGGMFKVDNIRSINQLPPPVNYTQTVRYWDKAGSVDSGAYTVGLKLLKLKNNQYIIVDVVRGQWSAEQRERIILQTAHADGEECIIYHEQEPGSGGKQSAEATTRMLAGFRVYAERPTGDKVYRADPFSVAVNNGDVSLLHGIWNQALLEEMRLFPYSTYKDQVDAGSGAFAALTGKKIARVIN